MNGYPKCSAGCIFGVCGAHFFRGRTGAGFGGKAITLKVELREERCVLALTALQ